MNDFEIIIPFRGTKLRNEILNIVISNLNAMFNFPKILIAEHSEEKTFSNVYKNIKYYHIKAKKGELFDRTGTLNFLAKKTKSAVIFNHDADCILEKQNYLLANNIINKKKYDMVIPYNGLGFNVSHDFSFKNKINLDNGNNGDILYLRWEKACGGIIALRRKSYIEAGIENPNIISWGYEDFERIYRFKKLGLKICGGHNSEKQRKHEACRFIEYNSIFSKNSLYHFDHDMERGEDSSGNPNINKNKQIANDILKLSKDQLKKEIYRWKNE